MYAEFRFGRLGIRTWFFCIAFGGNISCQKATIPLADNHHSNWPP